MENAAEIELHQNRNTMEHAVIKRFFARSGEEFNKELKINRHLSSFVELNNINDYTVLHHDF